jgi:hypothetical protein
MPRTVVWTAMIVVLLGYVLLLEAGPTLDTRDGLLIQVVAQKLIAVTLVASLVYLCFEADRVHSRLGG